MNDETKERRCKFCKKLLISEKMPICRRCKLEGRGKVGTGLVIVAGLFGSVCSVKARVGDGENDDSSSV